jgi:hypothetical protein
MCPLCFNVILCHILFSVSHIHISNAGGEV